MSYVSSYYHIVFSTLNRQSVITNDYCAQLYSVIGGIIKKHNCKPIIINGVENHIHILLSLNPTISLSRLMQEIKSQSSVWMKKSGYFPMFTGWEKEYGAFSLSDCHKDAVYRYIENQKIHHLNNNLDHEFERLILKNGLTMYQYPQNVNRLHDVSDADN